MFTRSANITIGWASKSRIMTSSTCCTWNFSSFTILTDFTFNWRNSWITALSTLWADVASCVTSSISIIAFTTWWTCCLTMLVWECSRRARNWSHTSIDTRISWWTWYALWWTITSVIITKWTNITCYLTSTTICSCCKRNNSENRLLSKSDLPGGQSFGCSAGSLQ